MVENIKESINQTGTITTISETKTSSGGKNYWLLQFKELEGYYTIWAKLPEIITGDKINFEYTRSFGNDNMIFRTIKTHTINKETTLTEPKQQTETSTFKTADKYNPNTITERLECMNIAKYLYFQQYTNEQIKELDAEQILNGVKGVAEGIWEWAKQS